jgi:esterase/lipase
MERVKGPVEQVVLERSYHVATLDYDKDEIEARTVEFLSGVLTAARP